MLLLTGRNSKRKKVWISPHQHLELEIQQPLLPRTSAAFLNNNRNNLCTCFIFWTQSGHVDTHTSFQKTETWLEWDLRTVRAKHGPQKETLTDRPSVNESAWVAVPYGHHDNQVCPSGDICCMLSLSPNVPINLCCHYINATLTMAPLR